MVCTVQEALKDWKWLRDMESLEVLRTTCLGDVIARDENGAEYILDVVAGELRNFDDVERQLLSHEPEFIKRMESYGLALGPGQCYGLKPHAIFKVHEPENVYVAATPEYVSFLGTFHHQVKDLPDGTKVRFKVQV